MFISQTKIYSLYIAYDFVFTWGVTLDIAHFDKPVGPFLHIVVTVGKHVQKQILLHSWKDALQVPVNE